MNPINAWLWIGRYRDTRNLEALRAAGIDAVLQLAEHVPQPGIETDYLAVEDGEPLPPGLLTRGLLFVRRAKTRGATIMIACGAGMSRSVVFAAAVLRDIEGVNLSEALQIIRSRHPPAMPHPVLWRSLCEACGEPFRRADLC